MQIVILFLFSFFLFSCERSFQSGSAQLEIQTPLTGSSSDLFSDNNINNNHKVQTLSTDLNSLDEVTCYAVTVHGPEPELRKNYCRQAAIATSQARPIGKIVGTVRAGEKLSLEVPAGNDRVFALMGFKSIDNYCPNLLTEKIDKTKISKPFLLGEVGGVNLVAGEVKSINLKMNFDSNLWFDECKGPDFDIALGEGGSTTTPPPTTVDPTQPDDDGVNLPASPMVIRSITTPSSIAISQDGLTLVVGDPMDSTDENGQSTSETLNAGAVYVFKKINQSWVFSQKLLASGTNGRKTLDYFGTSVAIDGITIAVGAPGHDFDTTGNTAVANAGAVFIYVSTGGAPWGLQTKIVASGSNARKAGDQFGYSLDISGGTVVVGAPYQDYNSSGLSLLSDAGAVFIYSATASVWAQQERLVPSINSRYSLDLFGYSVAIDNSTLVVGSPSHDYNSSDTDPRTDAGAAFVYTGTAGTWTYHSKIVPTGPTPNRSAGDQFGSSLDISGETIIVGAPYQDYDASGASPSTDAGAAYVFRKLNSTWVQEQKLSPSLSTDRHAQDKFGSSVAIHNETVVVGAPQHKFDSLGLNLIMGAGAVFKFSRASVVWSMTDKIVASTTDTRLQNTYFGYDVCISAPIAGTASFGINAKGIPGSVAGSTHIYFDE